MFDALHRLLSRRTFDLPADATNTCTNATTVAKELQLELKGNQKHLAVWDRHDLCMCKSSIH